MINELELTPFLEECPIAWRRFSQHVIEKTDIYNISNAGEAARELNLLLEPYGCEYNYIIVDGRIVRRFISFQTAEHRTWFLLKFSA